MKSEKNKREILVVGCGNLLFGDDGFGCEVISRLEKLSLPENVEVIDAGASGAYYLMTLVDEDIKKVIVVDAIDFGLKPGTVKKIPIEELPNIKKYTFDAHNVPLAPFLKDLHDNGIEVVVIGCQGKNFTMPYIKPGLSKEVEKSVDKAIAMILEEIKK
ncbi:coenzyme F420-reducing hydrogenase delta subunit [Methanocaldococcus vulcanius M7]|uniref:Coenzyme F420-reducing hydrogenase delta subunit n=1 Tax=Methanocaldococcus vulcanius (strain ATCC 700851 / DSM 12094 / M7) TaxID=579137 RepID=C9RG56_METVM|nr:coenzyme F420-reducing hydrogenase, FrhD protein [Methanocaldococcus vulcanius]ACX72558.1 coenzyme F420-reducing hydrogenase delta subunit [Methanocaldococcus vulcanius M7]